MSLLISPTAQQPKTEEEGEQALQSILIKQLLKSSGAFKGTGATGSRVTQELFADTLADAISKSGAFGSAVPVERHLREQLHGVAPTAQPPVQLPVASKAAHITSRFGQRTDPFDGTLRDHKGIDIAAPAGTPILAATDGVVISAGTRGGYGQAVEVKHASGATTLYAHASQVLVHPGDHVTQGQEIATVGETGRATGPHLHFELRQGGHPVDPTRALSVYQKRAEVTGEKPE